MTAEKLLGKLTAKAVEKYFANSEHRKQFEQWYLKTYKTPYVWKGTINGKSIQNK